MSFFSKTKKSEPVKIGMKESKSTSKIPVGSSASIANANNTNKIAFLEQEKQMLKVTLDHLIKENAQLKNQIEDMRQTVQHNKLQLKEYIDNITSKDLVVEKMNNTIEQLQSRLSLYESFHKAKNTNIDTAMYSTKNLNQSANQSFITDANIDPNQTSTKIGNPSDLNYSINQNQDYQNTSKMKQNYYHKKQKTQQVNYQSSTVQSQENNNNSIIINSNVPNNAKIQKKNPNIEIPIHISNNSSLIKKSLSINMNSSHIDYNKKQKHSPNASFNNSFVNIKNSQENKSTKAESKIEFKKIINTNNNVYHTHNTYQDPEKLKEILNNQQSIFEEILNIKNDMQFLMESATISKSKIKDKLNNSVCDTSIMNNSCVGRTNQSFVNPNNSRLNTSINQKLNTTCIYTNSKSNFKNCGYNIQERTDNYRKIYKFQDFLEEFDINKNVLLMVDRNGICWELVRRSDLSPEMIKEGNTIVSILNKEYENYIISDKLLNIELKDHDEDFHNSAMEISRLNESVIN